MLPVQCITINRQYLGVQIALFDGQLIPDLTILLLFSCADIQPRAIKECALTVNMCFHLVNIPWKIAC